MFELVSWLACALIVAVILGAFIRAGRGPDDF